MKSFKFKYKNILDIFKKNEASIKNRLELANKELTMQKNHLQELLNIEKNLSEKIKDSLMSGCKLNEIKNINYYKSEIKKSINNQNKIILQTQENISLIKKDLIEASKEVKMMEKLKERDYNNYMVEFKLDEEKTIDQIITYSNSMSRW